MCACVRARTRTRACVLGYNIVRFGSVLHTLLKMKNNLGEFFLLLQKNNDAEVLKWRAWRPETIFFLAYRLYIRPGAIPPSMIPTPIPIPAHLFDSDSDSDSSHLGYDSDSDSDSNTIFMNDSDSIPTPALPIFWLWLQNYISSDLNTSPGVYKMCKLFEHYKPYPKQEFKKKFCHCYFVNFWASSYKCWPNCGVWFVCFLFY